MPSCVRARPVIDHHRRFHRRRHADNRLPSSPLSSASVIISNLPQEFRSGGRLGAIETDNNFPSIDRASLYFPSSLPCCMQLLPVVAGVHLRSSFLASLTPPLLARSIGSPSSFPPLSFSVRPNR
ncbi:hypothetical protein COCNU_10G008590 [Cocos nucifera]|uniref:Uncharacterized protein n=1 Tax=Cocos nucifera TaxID=13894 RepID=A0A8K0IMA1_COCNU|nr:hypothetical protein COCNU_10G008590 [Cocos nucifera]